MEKIFEVNTNKYIEDMDLCDFARDTRDLTRQPLKTSGYIHHTHHSIRSPLLHTNQLQTKTSPERRIQMQNLNSKAGSDLELIWGRFIDFLDN